MRSSLTESGGGGGASDGNAGACHASGPQPTVTSESQVIALVGSPNSGKTTLFNWLTGSRFKTVNYPGSTVEHSIGQTNVRFGDAFLVMDTPGTYSLDPKSPDESVTYQSIFHHKKFGRARAVIALADATQLWRHLLLTKQLQEAGFNVILAVTMIDLLHEKGEDLDCDKLSRTLGIPVVSIDGRLGGGVQELTNLARSIGVQSDQPLTASMPWPDEKIESVLKGTAEVAATALKPLPPKSQTDQKKLTARERTRRLDRVLLHPVWGLVFFLGFMTALFSSIFWMAAPVMDLIDKTFSAIGEHVLAVNPESLLLQFLGNGVLASLGAVLVFVPQIFILFLGIILLEDSGYLARSATLIDRPLSRLGMGGRSFVPILSGYACAVPAMMAARTINSRRERWLTLFIIPLMSCSARLPVYALMLAFLFHGESAWKGGLMLTAIYVGSLVVGGLMALVAGKFLKIDERSFFMMELPVYRAPKLSIVLRQALSRTRSYIVRAGPPIFFFAVLIWAATTFPNYNAPTPTERLDTSYAGQLGQYIEPVFRPMGGDWRTGVGLLSAFAAREVFVASLAVVFQIADSGEDGGLQDTLLTKMHEAQAPDGYPLFTVASVLGLIVFFMIALQCLSTVMIAVRESGGWKFALMQLAIFNLVAYVLAVAIVQGLRAFGIA